MSLSQRDLLKSAFDDAATIMAESLPLGEPSADFLRTLAEAFRCEWATYWRVDPALHALRPVRTWNASDVRAQELVMDTVGRTLSLSEGTAGHVWRSRKPVWTVNLMRDMCLPRSLDAGMAGFRGGLWFAVKTDRIVYGVVELLGRDLPKPSDELVVAVEQYGFRLGALLVEQQARAAKQA
jgi:hypothetical protein